jgi:AcrR family transcriptional regulator
MAPRKYEQGLRAEAAEETRRRILDALYARLREQPAQPVSVDAIARAARVARSTVYLIFGSRAGLFDALAAELFTSGEFALVEQAAADPDARASLREGFRGSALMFAAHRDVFSVLYSTAKLDAAAVGGTVERLDEARARGMARIAERIDAAGLLRDEVTRERAEHVLWLLTSFESFDLLYTGRGLPAEAVAALLTETAERTLYR